MHIVGAMPHPPETGSSTNPLYRNRDFTLFWSSQVLSSVGTRATAIAFPLLVLTVTGSAGRAGLVGFAQTLPFLLCFLPAGAYVDRLDRKRIMLSCEAIRFAAVGSIAVALLADRFNLWHVLIVAFIEGSAMVFFEVAEAAALPHIVPSEQLSTALAQNQARQQAAELSGQPLGGFLFGVSRSVPFVLDALTYGVSFLALTFIRPAFQDQRDTTDTSILSDIGHGVTWLWRQRFLRALTGLVAASNFVLSALLLTVIVKVRELGASTTVVGFVLAGFGVGSLLGSLIAPAIQRRFGGRTIVVGSSVFSALTVALLIPADTALLVAMAFGALAITGPAFNVMVGKYRYGLTPDELQGRVMSASRVVAWGSIPLGAVAGGLALEQWGPNRTLAGLTAVMVGVAAVAVILPGLRSDPLDGTDSDRLTAS